jgi:LPXTG-site transpeptidase (sortase) family protein
VDILAGESLTRSKMTDANKTASISKTKKILARVQSTGSAWVQRNCVASSYLGWLFLPYLPALTGSVSPQEFDAVDFYVSPSTAEVLGVTVEAESGQTLSSNRLIVPKIGVNAPIVEGSGVEILDRETGVWRHPESSLPGSNGNTILAGHRFQYLPPNTTTFYNLDKMQIGDKILIVQNGTEYIYEVFETVEVTPDQTEHLAGTDGNTDELTLYTCAPLGRNDKRFVVKSRLVNI